MSDLKNKAVNSVMWTSLRTVISLFTTPLLLVLKARYLTPTEFGVLAIINIFMSIIMVIENTGLNTAIIQKDKITKNEESSLLIFQLIVCTVLMSIAFIVSPFLAQVFSMNSLAYLLPLISLKILFSGPIVIFSAFLEKELRFKEISIIQIVRTAALLVSTGFFFFIFNFGLLGVVLAQIIESLVGVVLILIVSYRNNYLTLKFHFSFSDIKHFLRFGVNVFGKEMLTKLTNHVDEIIIGYYFSAEILGYYYFAKNTLGQMRAMVSGALTKVVFPLFSQIKRDLNYLKIVHNKIVKYLGVLTFPIFIGVGATSYLFIPLFFGEQWLASNNFFVIISIASIPNFLISNLATSLLYTLNKPNLVLKIDMLVNGIYVLLLFIVSWLNVGIYSIVLLYAIYLIIKPLILQTFVNKELKLQFDEYIRLFKVAVIASLSMAIAVLSIIVLLNSNFSNLVILITSVVVGIFCYISIYFLMEKNTINDILKMITIA